VPQNSDVVQTLYCNIGTANWRRYLNVGSTN